MLKFTVISDTHNEHKKVNLPESDVIIHCGDFTNLGTLKEVKSFIEWFSGLNYKYKILIAGNHEVTLDSNNYNTNWKLFHKTKENTNEIKNIIDSTDIIYLHNTFTVIEDIKIYGTPYIPEESLRCGFPLKNKTEAFDMWDKIPNDTDILITHTPPHHILDDAFGTRLGCVELLKKVKQIKPLYHLFGHIHQCGYKNIIQGRTTFINASSMDKDYKIRKNISITFEL